MRGDEMGDMARNLPDVRREGLRDWLEANVGRSSRSPVATWFWEIDRVILLLALFLIAIGLVAVAAASPASAERYSTATRELSALGYFWRQAMWVGLSLPVLLVVSMLPVNFARRAALIGFCCVLVALALIPFIGAEVNGARRWIALPIGQFQPTEFAKPLFIVATAWILSFRSRDAQLPVIAITGGLTALVGGLVMLQPDFGQTVMFALIWLTMVTIAGASPRTIGTLGAVGVGGIVAAYLFYPTARVRIDGYLFGEGGQVIDTYQTDAAHHTLTAGGLLGAGPGAGREKFTLPEAHTDYIFAVVGEEFGFIACAIIAVMFLAVVIRVCMKLLDEEDAFRLLAAAGLAAQFGLQALISMAVNTGLAPSKGMTLPFISYGGSSMLALSIAMGLLLAFTRRNPFLTRSHYRPRWGSAR